MSEPIPVYDLAVALCERLGLDPLNVREVAIKADGNAVATVYRLDDEGRKYIDLEADEPAVDIVTIPVRTYA